MNNSPLKIHMISVGLGDVMRTEWGRGIIYSEGLNTIVLNYLSLLPFGAAANIFGGLYTSTAFYHGEFYNLSKIDVDNLIEFCSSVGVEYELVEFNHAFHTIQLRGIFK